jgi:Tfp pilus assembly protein PilX
MRITRAHAVERILRAEGGFTMLIAIGVLFVSGLLMVAAFTVANNDTHLSHVDTVQKQAYYAALAGIQEYEYRLESEPNYWETCGAPSGWVAEAKSERYEINLLAANGKSKCESSKPFETMIESTGVAANTFRLESVGCAGKAELTTCVGQPHSTVAVRKVVASFRVTGFLQFVYFTRFEDEDPTLYSPKASCERYYIEKSSTRSSECQQIQFITGDNVNGPMHSDDTAVVCGEPEFGRPGHSPLDKVEINGGLHESCGAKPIFNTESKSYSKGRELIPPASDESLLSYVESANTFSGVTQLVLNGTTNQIKVINNGTEKTVSWPENGLIYVGKGSGTCSFAYTGHEADGPAEKTQETNCGNVYVHGTYSKSLTIAAENDVIINGNTYPTSVTTLGTEPSGTAALGLIATHFVRVYHPVKETYAATKGSSGYTCSNGDTLNGTLCEYENSQGGCDAPDLTASEDEKAGGYGWGVQKNIWIYAAILSTKHSFAVDNYNCGGQLGELNVYGAIAQNFRGIVGTGGGGGGGGGGTGYIKNYNYDQRLATDEPPYFLEPLNTGWEVARETAPEAG